MRYFGALSPDSEFRLSDDFSELDPHQKTILSDDFGMGMSMHLMSRALGLQMFCDGKYFIDRLSHRVRCNITASKAKSGPRKSPDFVGVDGAGKWHVIECKGMARPLPASLFYAHRVVPRQSGMLLVCHPSSGPLETARSQGQCPFEMGGPDDVHCARLPRDRHRCVSR
jgi:hypothetical protein